jgi:cell division protein FtsB
MGRLARRLLVPVVLAVVTIGVLVLGAFPTRTLLDQRRSAASADARLEELEAANAEARAEVEALRTDAVIERIARQEYGLARPGEELYHVLPPAEDPVRVPDAWPFNGLGAVLDR